MNFQEANRRFRDLKRQYDAGHLTSAQFDEQRERLKVQDDQERWWAKGRGEDDWYYYDGSTWIRDTPPRTTTVPEPPPVLERPGPWIGGGIVIAVIGFFVAAGAGATSPLEFFGLLLSALGLYCGYKAVQKGSMAGGLATAVVSGLSLLFTLIFVLDQTL